MSQIRRTPLYDTHVAAGGTMVDFGGWEMPIQYPAGILKEHLDCRSGCGIFDVSHMGRLRVEGPQALDFLQAVLSSNAAALVPGRAQYCMLPDETGAAVDDCYLYLYEEGWYLLVVNAANTPKDLAHLAPYLEKYDCKLTDITEAWASVAIQGPKSEAILKALTGLDTLPIGPRKNDLGTATAQGRALWLARTGYTGEPLGFEIFIDAREAVWLWDTLISLGATATGLGARDTLRLEAGLPLYGHELGTDAEGADIPIFALSMARFAVSLKPEKGEFPGKAALAAQKEQGTPKKIMAIALQDRGVIRGGMAVYQGEKQVGWVTSGTMVPYFIPDEAGEPTAATGKRSLGFAYADSTLQAGDAVQIDVRGRRLSAVIVERHVRQDLPPYVRPIL